MTYEQSLHSLALRDPDVMVLTAENRAAIRELPRLLGERFLDFGIAEQTMVGAAAGLALRGRRPVVHALAAFLTMRAFEFVRTDVGIAGLPVTLVGGVPGFLSEANGPTHQAVEDIALMRGIPGMKVFCPADLEDLTSGLPRFLQDPSPCYIRYNAMPPAIRHSSDVAIGRAERLFDGEDITILTYGFLLREALRAREILVAQGKGVRLVNLRTLSPIDEGEILDGAADTGTLVTIEDHLLAGGLFTIVSEILVRRHVRAQVIPFALPERWFRPGLLEDVLETEGFTGAQIAARILDET
jgi:transketolase